MGKRQKSETNAGVKVQDQATLFEGVKKSILAKVGDLLLTEEGLLDMKLPKSVIKAAVNQADKSRKELSALVAKEVRMFLHGIELGELIRKVFAGQAIEVTATIRFLGSKEKAKKKKAPPSKKARP
jgi:hypothetical protein